MPIYIIIEIQITDAETYADYVRRVPETVHGYGGRYLVRGGAVTTLAGDWKPERVIVLEFPSAEHATRWGNSTEYRAVAELRERSAITRAIAVEGYVPPLD